MKITCRKCKRPAVAAAIPYCEAHLYEQEMGAEKAARQVALASADRDAKAAARKARRK